MNEKIMLFIDGGNFYHRLRELGLCKLLEFDYQSFASFLTSSATICSMRYFIGEVKQEKNNPKTIALMANQQRLFRKLEQRHWMIRKGQMQKINNAYHEKGVDVQIAIDMLAGAYEHLYDTLYLVSSDTDLLPALQKIRTLDRKIIYIGFRHKPSYAMIRHANSVRLLTRNDIEPFLPPQP